MVPDKDCSHMMSKLTDPRSAPTANFLLLMRRTIPPMSEMMLRITMINTNGGYPIKTRYP
jgi:hypothetical protein